MTTPLQPRQLTPDDIAKLKEYLISLISRDLDATQGDLRNVVQASLENAYAQTRLALPQNIREALFAEIINDIAGYGPIQELLDNPEITEVMVNGASKVYVERRGRLERSHVRFDSDEQVMHLIDRIILPLGRRIDPDSPTVDARLPDGSRVNAVIPPVAIDGPSITIRKFDKGKLNVNQLVEYGSITRNMAEFIRACVLARFNIVISGGTGSGKTTLLNVLSSFIPADERIVTIEDAAELALQQDHVLRLETKPPNIDGHGAVTVRDLVRNALRMRPDRIVVGEVRGGESLDMLQAMNTGHDGSLTTLHANSPRDAISRLETLCLMAGMDLPVRVIREQIASAVDVIIQQTRLKDGSRKVTAITEVAGMEGETVVLTDVFKFDQTGVDTNGNVLGALKPTGIRPLFSPRLEAAGFKLGPEVFGANLGDMFATRHRR